MIEVFGGAFRVYQADHRNIVVQRRTVPGKKKEEEEVEPGYALLGYYGSVIGAFEALVRQVEAQKLRDHDTASAISLLIRELKAIRESLAEEFQKLLDGLAAEAKAKDDSQK